MRITDLSLVPDLSRDFPSSRGISAEREKHVKVQAKGRVPCPLSDSNRRSSGYEPDMVGFADLGKCAKRLLRGRFQFSSFRVVASPIASSRGAMDARWTRDGMIN